MECCASQRKDPLDANGRKCAIDIVIRVWIIEIRLQCGERAERIASQGIARAHRPPPTFKVRNEPEWRSRLMGQRRHQPALDAEILRTKFRNDPFDGVGSKSSKGDRGAAMVAVPIASELGEPVAQRPSVNFRLTFAR